MSNTSKKSKTTKKTAKKPEEPKDKDVKLERQYGRQFSVPIQEARIDMENVDKLEGSLNLFKRDFDSSRKLYIDKMKRVSDDQLDSIMIYYTKVHPDILLVKLDLEELPKEAKIGLLAIKKGHAQATSAFT